MEWTSTSLPLYPPWRNGFDFICHLLASHIAMAALVDCIKPSTSLWVFKPLNPCGSDSKESTCNTGDPGSIPGIRDQTHIFVFPALAGKFFTTELPGKPSLFIIDIQLVQLVLIFTFYWYFMAQCVIHFWNVLFVLEDTVYFLTVELGVSCPSVKFSFQLCCLDFWWLTSVT